jgi:hypothetical protein
MLLKILLQGPACCHRVCADVAELAGPVKLAVAVMSHTMLDCSSKHHR